MSHLLETEADTILKEILFLAEKVKNAEEEDEVSSALKRFNYLHDVMQTIVNAWPVQELGADSICKRKEIYKEAAELFNKAVAKKIGWHYPNTAPAWKVNLNKFFGWAIFVFSAATLAMILARSFS